MLGRGFAANRLMTLFPITLPAIGLATVERLPIVYQLFRVLHGMMGIRLNGHPIFVRPLIFPMSAGSLMKASAASDEELERIKAASSASENYGNFYGQNLSPVQPGVLLVYGNGGYRHSHSRVERDAGDDHGRELQHRSRGAAQHARPLWGHQVPIAVRGSHPELPRAASVGSGPRVIIRIPFSHWR